LLMVAGEHRRPPAVPTPTGGAQTDRTARHDLGSCRSSLIVTDGRRPAPISIAATSEHTWKTAARPKRWPGWRATSTLPRT